MAETKSVLIIGATGVIGTYIYQAIVDANPPFEKVGIFTSQNTVDTKADLIATVKAKGVQVHVGDLTKEEDVKAAYVGYDTIVSAIGRPGIAKQIPLIEWAESTETVKKFFPSEYGTDIAYWEKSKDEKPSQLKLQVRQYIKEHVRRLEYTYLVTGPYADGYLGAVRQFPEAGGFLVKEKKAYLLGDPNAKVSLTTMFDVGRLLVGALRHPEAAKNKALIVNSFTTTPPDILAEYEKQTGGAKWESTYTTVPELIEKEKAAWDEVGIAATGITLRRIWTEGATLYDHRDNEKLGITDPQTLADIVAENIRKQTA